MTCSVRSIFLQLFLCTFVLAEDYYELLGISKDADNRDIRRAFKKLALKMHPDKNTDDKDAHEKFIKINKAYEVLKDEEMRKKYDLYGEEGLKDDFGKSWGGSYRSWNFYYESFGIYDDDPEIITLSRSDFEQSVLDSPDTWFINFYSPQCSHCHHLAPAWRKMARELENVVNIGAVNCEEDWMLCRQQNIYSYPSLIIYPEKEYYRGSRETDDLVEFILRRLPNKVIDLSSKTVKSVLSRQEYKIHPWLICVCKSQHECLFDDVLQKLSIILDGLVNVAKADVEHDEKLCNTLKCEAMVTYYQNLSLPALDQAPHIIDGTETKEILNEVLRLLPAAEELSDKKFAEVQTELKSSPTAHPWLVEFTKRPEDSATSKDAELKRLQALLPGVQFGHVDCTKYESVCTSWQIRKFPSFVILKPGGIYEFHHGRFTAQDISTFVRQSLSSNVETLSPKDFPDIVSSNEPWFIDFFAPWCPPCMQLLPEWRKASRTVGHLVRFGTVDCTMHANLCSQYNIRSYPTTILYNQSIPHQFHGSHNQKQLEEFVIDTLSPPVVSLTPQTFEYLVKQKAKEDMWVIDFFAPWCRPCQQLAPQWRKLAKMLKHDDSIHVGQVDCTQFSSLCSENGVNSYPTIRLYPKSKKGAAKFHFYNGWNRDASSLQAWVFSFLPSKVETLGTEDFRDILSDENAWIIDFYAPWCGHCQVFAPEFEKVAKTLEGKVHAGKVNCEQLPHVCQQAAVHAYPTVMFYSGKKGNFAQNPVGEEIHSMNHQGIISFIENRMGIKLKNVHDEL